MYIDTDKIVTMTATISTSLKTRGLMLSLGAS